MVIQSWHWQVCHFWIEERDGHDVLHVTYTHHQSGTRVAERHCYLRDHGLIEDEEHYTFSLDEVRQLNEWMKGVKICPHKRHILCNRIGQFCWQGSQLYQKFDNDQYSVTTFAVLIFTIMPAYDGWLRRLQRRVSATTSP